MAPRKAVMDFYPKERADNSGHWIVLDRKTWSGGFKEAPQCLAEKELHKVPEPQSRNNRICSPGRDASSSGRLQGIRSSPELPEQAPCARFIYLFPNRGERKSLRTERGEVHSTHRAEFFFGVHLLVLCLV